MAQAPLIDRHFLERLEHLTIHWQKSFRGLVGGHNMSRFAGSGQEFLDHRHFHQGDDLRAVNWRAYMRLEKLFLKMFQVEPRVPVRILLDVSESMDTGGHTGGQQKFDYARKLTAALCYIGLVRLDTICIQPFSDALPESFISTGGRHRVMPAVRFLSGLRTKGRSNFSNTVRQFAATFPQRGLVVVVSDFLDNSQQDAEKPLQYLADSGHELLLIQIWAPEDREPPWDGEYELVDAETGDHLEISLNHESRAAYTAAFDSYARRLQVMAQRSGGRYVGVPCSVSIEDAIFGPILRAGGVQ